MAGIIELDTLLVYCNPWLNNTSPSSSSVSWTLKQNLKHLCLFHISPPVILWTGLQLTLFMSFEYVWVLTLPVRSWLQRAEKVPRLTPLLSLLQKEKKKVKTHCTELIFTLKNTSQHHMKTCWDVKRVFYDKKKWTWINRLFK